LRPLAQAPAITPVIPTQLHLELTETGRLTEAEPKVAVTVALPKLEGSKEVVPPLVEPIVPAPPEIDQETDGLET
jgi:hypothetical protein